MASQQNSTWSADLRLCGEDETQALALALKDGLAAGDVVLLSGPIGAGKSHFARALIRAFLSDHGLDEDIPSPTYTLVQVYQAGELEIWHSDLYRLTSVDEVFELGLIDAFQSALCLVEWPDRLAEDTPANALSLNFGISSELGERQLVISASSPRWDWVKPLVNQLVTETTFENG